MVRAGTTYLLVKDERGSVRFVVDASSGAVAQALTYDPYGRVLSDTNPGFQPFGYAGGMWDPDTGLLHLGAREYDPDTGSFTRKDPSRFYGGENLYAYVLGDPINYVDPTGEGRWSVIGGAVGGAIEGAVVGYAEEGAAQALDPNFSGYDCDKIRAAAGWGAVVGGATGLIPKARGQGCFAPDTPVATAEGDKPIASVEEGDYVLSRRESGETSFERVAHVFVHEDAEQLALTFTDARGLATTVVTTPEHPFRSALGVWVPAGQLEVGANVETAEGALATLSAALSLEKRGRVFNLEVEGAHTYFVGAGREWVHNGNCGGGTKGGPRAGKDFTPAGKQQVRDANRLANGGKLVCAECGQDDLIEGGRAIGGQPRPANDAHVDHIISRKNGGDGSPSNGQVLCLSCNLGKGSN